LTRLVDGRMLGKRFEKDYTVEELERIYMDITSAVTVPVNVAIRAEHRGSRPRQDGGAPEGLQADCPR
jgi:hypothetical protein